MTQPSDDVAEDVRSLQGVLDDEGMGGPEDGPQQALDRLAARASDAARLLEENARLRRDLDSLKDVAQAARDDRAAVLDVKDATIKALADALWDARQYGDEAGYLCWCASPCGPGFTLGRRPECASKEAALRLSGRLP
jgi:hypothetical protein